MTVTTTPRELPVATDVGAAIYAIAWKRKISQAELGRVIGIGQNTMSRKLRGSVPITVDELVQLAAYLETDPRTLLPRLDSNQQPSGFASAQVRGYRSAYRLAS